MKGYKFLIIGVLLSAVLVSCRPTKISQDTNAISWNPEGDNEVKLFAYTDFFYEGIKAELVQNNIVAAIANYQKCIEYYPDDFAAHFKLGQVYYKAGRYADAASSFEIAFSLSNNDLFAGNQLVLAYMKLSEFKKAINVLLSLHNTYPQNVEVQLDLSNVYLAAGQLAKSIKVLDELEKQIGVTEPVSNQKKLIYLNLNKLESAVAEIEKLIKAYPENTDYIRLLIDVYVSNRKDDKVFDLYKKITEINPNDGSAQLILADYYLRYNMTEKANQAAEKAISNPDLDLNSKITFLLLNYLNKEINNSNKDIVLKYVEMIVSLHGDDSRVYSFRGDVKSALKQDDEALADYMKALEGEKNILLLWNKVIVGLMKKQDFQQSLQYCNQAIEHFPLSPELYLYAGMSNIRLKKFQEAASSLSSGLNYIKTNEILKFQFYANLGEAYNGLKEFTNSDEYFEKAIAIDSLDVSLLNNYAYYLSLRKDKLDRAEALSLKTITKYPDEPAYLDTYGWILFQKGNYQKAKEYIGKALEKRAWDADLLEHYGDVLYHLNDIEGAVTYWGKAKSKGSTSLTLDKKIAGRRYYE